MKARFGRRGPLAAEGEFAPDPLPPACLPDLPERRSKVVNPDRIQPLPDDAPHPRSQGRPEVDPVAEHPAPGLPRQAYDPPDALLRLVEAGDYGPVEYPSIPALRGELLEGLGAVLRPGGPGLEGPLELLVRGGHGEAYLK